MIVELDKVSPFYAAYSSNADVINAALEKAAEESANKMGASFNEVYSIKPVMEQKAA